MICYGKNFKVHCGVHELAFVAFTPFIWFTCMQAAGMMIMQNNFIKSTAGDNYEMTLVIIIFPVIKW